MARHSFRVIDRQVAAEIAGCSARHLQNLEDREDPPPWVGEGYRCDQFGAWLKRRWMREMGVSEGGEVYNYEIERARLTKAQADRTELEAAELRGDMVRAEAVMEAWGRMLGNLRQRLLSLPTKAAPQVRGAASDMEAAALIEAEVLEALQELSDDGLDDRTRARRERREERAASAAEANGERVGGRVPAAVAGKRRGAGAVED